MSKTKVVFRADGNSEIGLGHVIRSLALAEMLKKEFDCVFAIQEPSESLYEQIMAACGNIIQLPACSENEHTFINELDNYLFGNEIVVLDGYRFSTNYQQQIKSKGCSLVCIDDIHSYYFVADAIINHAGGISKDEYSSEKYTQFYLGPQFALLRPPFLKSHRSLQNAKSITSLLINMGGADPYNETLAILQQIIPFDFFHHIHIVTGSAYKFQKELSVFIQKDIRLVQHSGISANEMAKLMKECGVCVCPPSSVSFEYMSIGGLLFLKQIAENQKQVKEYFIEQGVAFEYENDFERIMNTRPEQEYNEVIANQNKILDGRSGERLVAVFNKLELNLSLALRKVQEEDMMICYEWANDPEVRKSSYNSEPIPLESHSKWFASKMNDPLTNFYIIEYKSKPVGLIRYDGREEKLISYLISSEMRGKGLGSIVLKMGVDQLLKDTHGTQKISGFVKRSNIASCKAFEKAGFHQIIDIEIPFPDSIKYEMIVF